MKTNKEFIYAYKRNGALVKVPKDYPKSCLNPIQNQTISGMTLYDEIPQAWPSKVLHVYRGHEND